ncbi:MAG: UPF0182 family protein, partial [Gemmatimonadota bacterium]
MSRRARLIAWIVGGVILLLFGGRWATVLLTERWWGDIISPEAGRFITRYQLLRFVLDVVGVLFASAWFITNFYIVYRAIGSVQVPRRVANLEIHEALTPRALVLIAVGAGVAMGLLTGLGTAHWWENVLLAWQGVIYGSKDPVLGHDLGLYVAQLPLWRRLHGLALLLTLLALGSAMLLYVMVGAIRWSGRRPAINDHARHHLGWLLAALVLVLAWGYWLEPFEMVAGLATPGIGDTAALRAGIASALTGLAIAVAVISLLWALRPRHALMVVGWIILALASILGHHVIPAIASSHNGALVDDVGLQKLERAAFGLSRLENGPAATAAAKSETMPGPLSLWDGELIAQVGEGDSTSIVSANQSILRVRGRRLPVWITLRVHPDDSLTVSAYADDRTSAFGGPLSYRLGDTLAYPGTVRLLQLPPDVLRPRNPEDYAITADSNGVPIHDWGRRLLLAWARQAGRLFDPVPENGRLAWHLDPQERLETIAPQVRWGRPCAHVVEGELLWLVEGYVYAGTFPIVQRAQWRGKEIATLESPFLAVVNAGNGETRIYRRPWTGALGKSWQAITGDVARPWNDLPMNIAAQLNYPEEFFELQARVLERSHWVGSRQTGRTTQDRGRALAAMTWGRQDTTMVQIAGFEATGSHTVTAVLQGSVRGGAPRLVLTRIEGQEGLGNPAVLSRNWSRFATYEQLRDSLRSAGAEPASSPVGVWIGSDGVGAFQAIFGKGPDRRIAIAWVNLAVGDSLGAGRTVDEAWQNLLGKSAPLLGIGPTGRLAEAERWMTV